MANAYSSGDRHGALTRLARFSERPEFEPRHDAAEDEFWALLDHLPEAQTDDPDILEQSDLVYEDWFALDRAGDDGVTPVEILLRREADRLTPGEREYLERLSRTQLRLYEVSDVAVGDGLHVVDLWTNERLFVREHLGPGEIVRSDLLAARLMPGPDGQVVIEGQALLYPAAAKKDILAVLRRADRRLRRQGTDVPDALFFKSAVTVLHFFWMMGIASPSLPTLVTAEGDSMIFAAVVFDVRDPAALMAALAHHADLLEQDDGGYLWVERGGKDERTLGALWFDGDRLVLDTTSRQRAGRGRQMIEEAAGGAIGYRTTRYEEVVDAVATPDDLGAAPVTSSVTPRRQRKGTRTADQLGFGWAADGAARAEDAQGP